MIKKIPYAVIALSSCLFAAESWSVERRIESPFRSLSIEQPMGRDLTEGGSRRETPFSPGTISAAKESIDEAVNEIFEFDTSPREGKRAFVAKHSLSYVKYTWDSQLNDEEADFAIFANKKKICEELKKAYMEEELKGFEKEYIERVCSRVLPRTDLRAEKERLEEEKARRNMPIRRNHSSDSVMSNGLG